MVEAQVHVASYWLRGAPDSSLVAQESALKHREECAVSREEEARVRGPGWIAKTKLRLVNL